jgi:hypothetical protein
MSEEKDRGGDRAAPPGVAKAQRLREKIEKLKSGQANGPPGKTKSLREQIEERANRIRAKHAPPDPPLEGP